MKTGIDNGHGCGELRNVSTVNDEFPRKGDTTHELPILGAKPTPAPDRVELLRLPVPVFPRYPEKCRNVEPDPKYLPRDGNPYRTHVTVPMVARALRGWLYPYIGSRVKSGEFHPIISYLFTEWKCNLDCHYCWAYNDNVKGMTEDVARHSIDWLHDTGCRVLALMGGEVLLRPQFVHQAVDYAARKGFWVYVATNGRLMCPDVIDRLGDAGVAAINMAVDSVKDRQELPKSLASIRPHFDYLIKKQHVYGFSVFFNINITRINLYDVIELTKIAHDAGIATDYHLNEAPMLEQPDFEYESGNSTYITPKDWRRIDAVIDWLIAKNRSGYRMVNSVRCLEEMKTFMRGNLQQWGCRAGQNSLIIRTDGTLAPCFPMYSATRDWGIAGQPHFESPQLASMKVECQRHCFSTPNHNLSYCYNASRAIRWVLKQAAHGFHGTTGGFED